jgi:hypothetical protein
MLERLRQHLRIGVASGGVAIARMRFRRPQHFHILAERRTMATEGFSGIMDALSELLDATPQHKATVSVVLADDLVRMWQVTPPPACSRMSDLQAAAALRYRSSFGADLDGWKIAADYNAIRPFLAVAVPEALVDGIEQLVRERHGQVVQVQPQFVAALNQWSHLCHPGVWFGLVHAHVLTLALFDGAALAAVRSTVVPPGAGCDWLDGCVTREALRVGLHCPERIQLCGSAPAVWGSSVGSVKFACNLLENDGAELQSDFARLVRTGDAR